MSNAINWFQIPASDFERAKKFYGEILGSELQEMSMEGYRMGVLPASQTGVGGAIVSGEPSPNGTTVYLNGGSDLSTILSKVENAGGKVVMPKTIISEEIGYMAMFSDSEGNTVGLHSQG